MKIVTEKSCCWQSVVDGWFKKSVIETKCILQSSGSYQQNFHIGWFLLWVSNRPDNTHCSFLFTSQSCCHCSLFFLATSFDQIHLEIWSSVRTVLCDFCCGECLNSRMLVMKVKTFTKKRCRKWEKPLWSALSLSTIEMWLVFDMQLIIQSIVARWEQVSKDPFDEPCFLFFFSVLWQIYF